MPQELECLEVSLFFKTLFSSHLGSEKALEYPIRGCNLHFGRYESGELRKEEEEDEEAAADRDWKRQQRGQLRV